MGSRFATVLLLALTFCTATGCGDSAAPESATAAVVAPDSAPKPVSIASDDGAGIADWLLSVADGRRQSFLPTLTDIIRKAAPEIRFQILFSGQDPRPELRQQLEEAGFDGFDRIKWLEVSSRISWWARDFFIAGTEDDGEPVAMLHHPDHYRVIQGPADGNGATLLEALRTLLPVRTLTTRARLEGGAVVAGERHVFITPTVCQNAVAQGKFEDWADFLAYLRRLYGRPVVVLDLPLGSPWEHADLYLTPIGESTILVGDSTLAASLLGKSAPEQLSGFSRRLSKFANYETNFPRLERTDPPALRAWLRRDPDPVTRRLLRQLMNLGYRVEPLPWLVFEVPGAKYELRLSYNNVIMESRRNQHTVYLPKYGLADIDAAARATYERHGYRVVEIDALGPALFGGSIRCLSQVFRR